MNKLTASLLTIAAAAGLAFATPAFAEAVTAKDASAVHTTKHHKQAAPKHHASAASAVQKAQAKKHHASSASAVQKAQAKKQHHASSASAAASAPKSK